MQVEKISLLTAGLIVHLLAGQLHESSIFQTQCVESFCLYPSNGGWMDGGGIKTGKGKAEKRAKAAGEFKQNTFCRD